MGRHDENRCGVGVHDLSGGLDPIHIGHDHIHGDEIRCQPLNHFNGPQPVFCMTDNLNVGI